MSQRGFDKDYLLLSCLEYVWTMFMFHCTAPPRQFIGMHAAAPYSRAVGLGRIDSVSALLDITQHHIEWFPSKRFVALHSGLALGFVVTLLV